MVFGPSKSHAHTRHGRVNSLVDRFLLPPDSDLHGQTDEGVLVPESFGQANGVTHQKDSHKDRQLSGQDQNGHLNKRTMGETSWVHCPYSGTDLYLL